MSTIELEREIQAEQDLAQELAKYAGQWVAVRQHEVAASAASLEELIDEVGKEEAASFGGIFQVPEHGTACYF